MAEAYLTLLRMGNDLKGNEKGILKVMSGNSYLSVITIPIFNPIGINPTF